jgi:hypothetical protein
MDTRDQASPLAARYADTLVATIEAARAGRAAAAAAGRDARARNFDRLLGFLDEQLIAARAGTLPARRGYGFALSRYVDEYEWGEEGSRVLELVHDLQHIWSEQPRD